jgi:hypothetical protein
VVRLIAAVGHDSAASSSATRCELSEHSRRVGLMIYISSLA